MSKTKRNEWESMDKLARQIHMANARIRNNQRMDYILAGNSDFRKTTEDDEVIELFPTFDFGTDH